jgi:hypothetical protein
MNRDSKAFQRPLALILIAALTALSSAVPLLDLMVGDGKAAIETEHHPDTHGFAHDHLICIQQQASQGVPPSNDQQAPVVSWVIIPPLPDGGNHLFSSQLSLPNSRAPPHSLA